MFYIAIALNIHLKEDRKSLPNTCPYIINLCRLTDTSNSVMNDIAVSVLYLTGYDLVGTKNRKEFTRADHFRHSDCQF